MNDQPDSFFPGPDVFTRAWSDFATQMMQAGMAFTPDKTPPAAARDMRNAMLTAWSDYCDQFMRSPEFLKMMKQSLSASVQARKQLNDYLGQVQHEFQSASRQDVDQLMLSLRHMERRFVDSIERVSEQLDGLSARLDNLEEKRGNASGQTEDKKKSSKQKQKEKQKEKDSD